MKLTFSMLMGCLLCGMSLAQEPSAADLFDRTFFMVHFPEDSVQFESGNMSIYKHGTTLQWNMCFIDKYYTLKEIKDCCMYDATGRNLQAKASYSGGYHVSVTAAKDLYAQGDWVDVQGVAVVAQHSSPCQETVVFPGTQNGSLPLKHGSFAWEIDTDEDGVSSISFSAGNGIARLFSIGYTDAEGDWMEIEDIDEDSAYSLYIPEGTELIVRYSTSGAEIEVPFRYRLTMSGAESLPYLPEPETTKAAPTEKDPVQLIRAEHPVTITPASLHCPEDGTCTLQLNARLFSDTQTIANARLKNISVKDAQGKLPDVEAVEVNTDADSAEAEITFAAPATSTVTVSGVFELEAGDTAARMVSVMVPCRPGATFSVGEYRGKVVPVSANERREIMENINGRMEVEEVQVVQLEFENVPASWRSDDIVVTTDKGKGYLIQSTSAHTTPILTKRDVLYKKSATYTLGFDGPVSQLNVSVDSRKSATTRSFPFEYQLNVSGVIPPNP